MSSIDRTLKANESFAESLTLGHLPAPPARQLAIVTCMDARIMVEPMLGLELGDAHIIRNAGGIVTEDVLRSLLISHYVLFTQEFMIINHTDCGLLTLRDDELRTRLQQVAGTAAVVPTTFHTFTNLEENLRQQVQKIRSHPWIPDHIPVRGFIYDVGTGKLSEVFT